MLPKAVTLVGLKAERVLKVRAAGVDRRWTHLKDYPMLGMTWGAFSFPPRE
jgi:hypothetical protein